MNARPVRVAAVHSALLGHTTYTELLQRAFATSERTAYVTHSAGEIADVRLPGLKRLFFTRPPLEALRSRHLDFYTTRYEVGTSYVARAVVQRVLAESAPDVLHLHTQSIALLSHDLMTRVPTVLTADMTAPLTAEQSVPASWRWTYAASVALERAAVRRAAAVVAFSERTAASYRAAYGLAPERVHVIPPGVDPADFAQLERSRRRPGPVRILFVGGEFERKGGPTLVAAFLERFAGAHVRLDLVTRSTDVPAHPQIVVHRDVSAFSPAWRALYGAADVFALPSRREPWGFAYVEAMAAGLPVVATETGAVREIVADGETGFVVPVDDVVALGARLARLVADPELRARMGSAGVRRVAERFDARVNARRLEELFVAVSARAATERASAAPLAAAANVRSR